MKKTLLFLSATMLALTMSSCFVVLDDDDDDEFDPEFSYSSHGDDGLTLEDWEAAGAALQLQQELNGDYDYDDYDYDDDYYDD